MTQDELDALPENNFEIGAVEEIIDGKTVQIPKVMKARVLFHGPDDYLLIYDRNGLAWSTGWVDGKRYKQRV